MICHHVTSTWVAQIDIEFVNGRRLCLIRKSFCLAIEMTEQSEEVKVYFVSARNHLSIENGHVHVEGRTRCFRHSSLDVYIVEILGNSLVYAIDVIV